MEYNLYAIDQFIETLNQRWEERKITLYNIGATITDIKLAADNEIMLRDMFGEDEIIFIKQVMQAYCEEDSDFTEKNEYYADLILTYWELFDTVRYRIQEYGYVPGGENSINAIYAAYRFFDNPLAVISDDDERCYFAQFLEGMLDLVEEEIRAINKL